MYTLAVINQKGGVGKTTSAVTLAHGLALRSRTVVLVDLDAQGNVADALGLEKRGDLYGLLLERGGARESGRPGLSVVLSDKTTVQAREILAGQPFREMALERALARLGSRYQFCVLDVAPGVDLLQIAALVACDGFIIPVALDHLAVVGASDALDSAVALSEYITLRARFLGVLPTFWERTTNESQAQLEALVAQFERWVWPPIPLDVRAREAPRAGQTLWEHAPGTRALAGVSLVGGRVVGGYRQVIERLLREAA